MMTRQEDTASWRNRVMARFAWLGGSLQYWSKPSLAAVWLSAVLVAVILSVLPGSWVSLTRRGLPDAVGDVIEPLSHFLGYAVLVGFVSMACNRVTTLIYVCLAAIGISVSLELVQLLVPERGASFQDLSMNVLGASAGFLFGVARLRRSRRVSVSAQNR